MSKKYSHRLITIIGLSLMLVGCRSADGDLRATIDAQETIIAQSVQSIPDGTAESDTQETTAPEFAPSEDSGGLTSRIQNAISTLEPIQSLDPFIGYDLTLDATTDGKDQYSIGIALVNTTDEILNPSLPNDPVYVTTQDGDQYIAQVLLLRRLYYRDHSSPAFTGSENIFGRVFLPPSSIVLESTEHSSDGQGFTFHSISWVLNFAVLEGKKPYKIEVPGVMEIDLKNVMSRGDIRLPFPTNHQLPLDMAVGDFMNMTVSNTRSYTHPTLGPTLAFDVDFINNDLTQNHQAYFSFSIIDAFGALLNLQSNECGDPSRDGVLPWPVSKIELGPGQQVSGVICVWLNPSGYDGLSEYWVWNVLEEIDPRELGLDPEGVMEVKGIEATFDELREGVELPDGKYIMWIGNKRLGRIEIAEKHTVSFQTPLLNNKHLLYVWADEPVRGAIIRDINDWHILAIPLND